MIDGCGRLRSLWQVVVPLLRPGLATTFTYACILAWGDFLFAREGAEMTAHLRALSNDPALRASLVAHGLETIRARHTCAHRAQELLSIAGTLGLNLGASAA